MIFIFMVDVITDLRIVFQLCLLRYLAFPLPEITMLSLPVTLCTRVLYLCKMLRIPFAAIQ